MARRAARYRLMCGDRVHEPSANDWFWAVKEGIAIRSKNDRKLAHVLPRYRFWVDEQTGVLGFALTSRPERCPEDKALQSSWFLVLRHALLYGPPDVGLFELHDQVYAGCALAEPIH